ncbi:MAG: hypothetical protein HYZ53_17075 [Planctomycetes bacterium]|nr:hypothetical protein [Planctomycetota bacterium]
MNEQNRDSGGALDGRPSPEDEQGDAHVVERTDELLADARRSGVTAIAFTPLANGVRLSLLRGGRWVDERTLQPVAARMRMTRIKILAGLDLSERSRPQQGILDHVLRGERIVATVASLPSDRGEVLHIDFDPPLLAPAAQAGVTVDAHGEQAHAAAPNLIPLESCASVLEATGLVAVVGSDSELLAAFTALARRLNSSGKRGVLLGRAAPIGGGLLPEVAFAGDADWGQAWALRAARRLDFDAYLLCPMEDADSLAVALELGLDRKPVYCGLRGAAASDAGELLLALGADPWLLREALVGALSAQEVAASLDA